MQCTKCGSENTQRLEVIFQGGTQQINTESKTAGIGVGRGLGLGGAVTTTSGTSQSILAEKAAPPAKRSLKGPIIGILIGLLLTGSAGGLGYVGYVIILASAFAGYKAIEFNSKSWPGLYQHWMDSWMCQKCGTIYHQA